MGFPRVSIFQPAFLKTMEDRADSRPGEKLMKWFIPIMDTVFGEKRISASVVAVARAMRIVAQEEYSEKVRVVGNAEITQLGN